jgi:ribosomal protein S27E
MGSVVEFRCRVCTFSTERLSIGWGKAGRQRYWGALARCTPCQTIGVVDLSVTQSDRFRDRRCTHCNGPLTVFEGISETIPCPRCSTSMHHAPLGMWN